jgi:hypothetical protein
MAREFARFNIARMRLPVVLTIACFVAGCEEAAQETAVETRILQPSVYEVLPPIVLTPGSLLCGTDVPDCTVERGGRVALGDSDRVAFAGTIRNKQIRVLSAGSVRLVGREGSGPGEYQSVLALGYSGANTLRAFDLLQHRVIAYDSDGSVLSTDLVPVPAQGFTGAAFVRGELRILATDPSTKSGDSAQIAWFASDPRARRSRKLRTLNARQRAYSIQDMVPIKAPFAPAPRWSVDAGGTLFFSSGATFSIDVFDSTGAHTLRFGFDVTPRRVTSLDLETWRRNAVRGLPSAAMQAVIRGAESSAVPRHAAITDIRALQNGEVWVREAESESGEHVRWIVFDSSRAPTGVVTLSADDDVVAARGPAVLVSQPATRRGMGTLRWFTRKPAAR